MERKAKFRKKLVSVPVKKEIASLGVTELDFLNSGNLTLRFGDERVVLNYKEHLSVDEDNLDYELARQPALYVYYAKLLGMQKALLETAKNELREYEGKLYTFLKSNLARHNVRRPTEAEVIAKKNEDVQYKQKKRKLVELQLQLDVLWSIRDSLIQKKDCIVTLAANRRREWDTDLFIKKLNKGSETSLEAAKRSYEERKKNRK